jgi:hypothetical protein
MTAKRSLLEYYVMRTGVEVDFGIGGWKGQLGRGDRRGQMQVTNDYDGLAVIMKWPFENRR